MIDKYIDRSDFIYCQMDTDSAYIAFSGENFEDLIKPELKEDYLINKNKWFPRGDTKEAIKKYIFDYINSEYPDKKNLCKKL